jgi:hypothetical protein
MRALLAASLLLAACSSDEEAPPVGGPDASIDPVTVTIRQVQDPDADGHVPPGTLVRIEDAVVTARGNLTDDFTVQDDRAAEAPFSGLYIEVASGGELVAPVQGDRVSVTGVVAELAGEVTALTEVTAIDVGASGAELPEPVAAAVGDLGGALDGVMVTVAGPHEIVLTSEEGELLMASGLAVGPTFFAPDPLPGPGDVYASITGPLVGAARVLPRAEIDLAGYAVAAHLARIVPDVVALAPGQSRTLSLELDAVSPTAFTVCLDSTLPAVAAPAAGELAVAAGQSAVDLDVHAMSAHADPAILRAWRAIGGSCAGAVGAAITARIAVTEDRIAGPGDLAINEVLSDPPGTDETDMTGDASCDGLRSSADDEFVEIINVADAVVDLSGVTVTDRVPEQVVRHVFAPGSKLAPGEAILVYGALPGISQSGPWCAALAAARVVIASQASGLDLNNAGDTVTLHAADGQEIARFDYSALVGAHNQSITRDPDVSGAPVLYGSAQGHLADRAFSPGTRNDGTSFP